MFKIYDGRQAFYQWDKDRKLIVNDNSISQIHFSNKADSCSYVCEVYTEDGLRVVDVPNILLQEDWRIDVYGYDANYTKYSQSFKVIKRSKPEDYIYTDEELKVWEDLEKRVEDLENGINLIEPAVEDIPKIFFDKAIPQTKDDIITKFRYISKTKDIEGYAEFKAQGSSSMSYPKKNMTVKMYADEALENKLKVDFKGWGKQNKHCYKANWIDLTHARNIVSARLWADIVRSRANYDNLPEELKNSPNMGAVDGFPVKVYSQGIYQGRYTLNIPKDAWMANMDKDNENHCILCGENYVSGCFRELAKIDESDWTDEIHDTVPEAIKNRWNEVIDFVMNSTDEEFKNNLNNYIDVNSLIDYHLFGLASCGLDAYGKNQIYMTYDGLRWFASMYDMDSTWGLWWNGSYFVPSNYKRAEYQDFKDGEGNLLYIRLEKCFWDELIVRWDELKNGALSLPNIINHFERFTDIANNELIVEDYANTTGEGNYVDIPSKDTNNIQQIRDFIVKRIMWCDRYINSSGNTSLIFSIENTTLDGNDYIDTNLQLKDLNEYTVLMDYTINSHDYNNDIEGALFIDAFASYENYNQNSGWWIRKHRDMWEVELISNPAKTTALHIANTETSTIGSRYKVAIKKTAEGKLIVYTNDKYPNGNEIYDSYDESNMDSNTLILGAHRLYENIYGYANMTIHSAKVYDEAIIDADITAFFNENE